MTTWAITSSILDVPTCTEDRIGHHPQSPVWPACRLVGRSVGRLACWPVGRSVGLSVCLSPFISCHPCTVDQPRLPGEAAEPQLSPASSAQLAYITACTCTMSEARNAPPPIPAGPPLFIRSTSSVNLPLSAGQHAHQYATCKRATPNLLAPATAARRGTAVF